MVAISVSTCTGGPDPGVSQGYLPKVRLSTSLVMEVLVLGMLAPCMGGGAAVYGEIWRKCQSLFFGPILPTNVNRQIDLVFCRPSPPWTPR
jgi:hypothetical protein